MAIPWQGVIKKVGGDLLRCGYVDFENDGSFDSVNEEIRTDVPFPAVACDGINAEWHQWTGTEWIFG